jgi:hypothetical protein
MISVAIFQIPGHERSKTVCAAMKAGIEHCGDRVTFISASRYASPICDVAVFYGLAGRLAAALRDYPAAGKKAIYVDLGYWKRKDIGSRWDGYHKLVVNGRHPTGYFQHRPHDDSRAQSLGLSVLPWRKGRNVVIAGMGPKGAAAEGFAPGQWEADAVRQIRAVTDRPIIYRPKPNWKHARPIAGATMGDPGMTLAAALADAHCVVSHHSNAGVEGLMMGIPCFTIEGVALPMGRSDLALIEQPHYPAGREQWAADLAFVQWNVDEMRRGLAWRHLRDEGLV